MEMMLAGLSAQRSVSSASVPGQVAECKLRFRGYSPVAALFLNQKSERLNGQEDRSTSRKQVLPGKVTKKQNLLCQLQSSLISEPGGRQLGDLKNTSLHIQQAVLVNI